MPIRKKQYRPRLGRGGKYNPIFGREARSATLDGSAAGKLAFCELADEIAADTVAARIAQYEELAREILAAAGLPTDYPGRYPLPGGGWGTLMALVEARLFPDESAWDEWDKWDKWYAAQILRYAYWLRNHIQAGDTENAVRSALLLQREVDVLGFREYELPALIGMKPSRQCKYTKADKAHWEERARSKWQKHRCLWAGRPSCRQAAKEIAEETGYDFDSIRKHLAAVIDKHKK